MSKLLVVVDMQNDFIDGSLGSEDAVKIVPNVCKKIREFDGDIICTLDVHNEFYLRSQEGKNLPIVHCVKGTEGFIINADVQKALDEKGSEILKFEKINRFGSPELAYHIRDGRYESVEFIGLCTDICVVVNALTTKAVASEIPIIVDSSCCAGISKESHQAALDVMKTCQIKII